MAKKVPVSVVVARAAKIEQEFRDLAKILTSLAEHERELLPLLKGSKDVAQRDLGDGLSFAFYASTQMFVLYEGGRKHSYNIGKDGSIVSLAGFEALHYSSWD